MQPLTALLPLHLLLSPQTSQVTTNFLKNRSRQNFKKYFLMLLTTITRPGLSAEKPGAQYKIEQGPLLFHIYITLLLLEDVRPILFHPLFIFFLL